MKAIYHPFFFVYFLCYAFLLFPEDLKAQSCLPQISCENRIVTCIDPAASLVGNPGYTPDFLVSCSFDSSDFVAIPWPVVISDCDSIYAMIIYRSWSLPGFPSLCMDTTYVLRVNIESDFLICPSGKDTVVCGVDADPLTILELRAPRYGVPVVDTFPLLPEGPDACGVLVTISDMTWNFCGNTKTVMRSWLLHDLCGRDTICYDTIVIIDTIAPLIRFDTSTLTLLSFDEDGLVGTFLTDTLESNSHECVASGLAPYGSVSDNCSSPSQISVSVTALGGLNFFHYQGDENVTLPLTNLSGDKEILVYKTQDHCGNFRMDTVVIVIVDKTAPNAVCHGSINVNLGSYGLTFMKALSLDSRSSDNCALYQILARRTDWQTACGYQSGQSTPMGDFYQQFAQWVAMDPGICQSAYEFGFAPEVPFCCDDAGRSIMVELLVIDQFCNVDRCWGFVNVEDKMVAMVAQPLPDLQITCTAFVNFYEKLFLTSDTLGIREAFGKYVLSNLEQDSFYVSNIPCGSNTAEQVGYRDGLALDNCDDNWRERYTWDSQSCGNSLIIREFVSSTSSHSGLSGEVVFATQRIHIIKCPIEMNDVIAPVRDTTVYACGVTFGLDGKVNIVTRGPILATATDGCGEYAIGYFDKVFEIVSGAGCNKVLRTWCVVDWCEVGSVLDWASISKLPGSLTFLQYIKVIDTVPPVISPVMMITNQQQAGCLTTVSASINVTDSCGQPSVKWTLKGTGNQIIDQGSGLATSIDQPLPAGSYTLLWTATDGCGNTASLSSPFTLSSGAKPSVVAKTSLTTTLTPMDSDSDGQIDTGIAVIWAEEFNSSSAPACGSVANSLLFLIKKGVADSTSTVPPDTATSLTFSCDDFVGNPTVIPIQFWVKDTLTQMSDYLNVMLLLYDNHGVCDGSDPPLRSSNSVKGQIITELAQRVVNVEVHLQDGNDDIMTMTSSEGEYELSVTGSDQFRIHAKKDSEPGNGVSTSDLIRLQKHILGIKPLGSPYKLIAADANRDGKINPLDLVQIRKLILGVSDQFLNNSSWRFIDAEYRFKNPERALEEKFPEVLEWDSTIEREKYNLIGVKVGDLDGNVFTSRSESRAARSSILRMPDVQFRSFEEFMVPVYYSGEASDGLQFQLQTDPSQLEIAGIHSGSIRIEGGDFHVSEDADKLSVSLISMDNYIGSVSDEPLFVLEFKSKARGMLSNNVAFNGTRVQPEIYSVLGEVNHLRLDFEWESENLNSVVLAQNQPNPFRSETVVQFTMPAQGKVELRLYDTFGRLIKTISGDYSEGSNQIVVSGHELIPGIVYYELRTRFGSLMRKMLVLE